MTLLLDTHVWFWSLQSPDELGKRCRTAVESPANDLAVATISTLEQGQLISVNRIVFKGTLESWVRRGTAALGLKSVELSHPPAILAYDLPGTFHKDPADRMLLVTAIHYDDPLVTADERLIA